MKPATTLALVALATSLGGCKSFVQAFDFSRHSSEPQYAIGPADLEEGRKHLREGNVGNALAPLHRAALNRETSGEALNALGVAYAKLGRADLAERYFIAATRIDAGNERFAANLARFYRSDLAQDVRLAFLQRQKAAQEYAAFANGEAGTPAEPVLDQRIVRSGGETRTLTISQPAVSQRVRVGKAEAVAAEPAPQRVRVSGTALVQPAASRPAEIHLTSQPAAPVNAPRVRVGAAAQEVQKYPLRVRLAPRVASDKD